MKYKFKVGDKVKRFKGGSFGTVNEGDVVTIKTCGSWGFKIEDGTDYKYDEDKFELYLPTKDKISMEKKFKNKLSIAGSISLLKAFGEELEKLGYVPNKPSGRFDLIGRPTHILTNFDNYQNEYGYHNHTGGLTPIYLPQDWDKALKLAAEVEEVIPEYVECIKNDCPSYQFGEVGKVYKVKTWHYSSSDCMLEGSTNGSSSRKRFKPSTKEAYKVQQVILPKVGKWYKSKIQLNILVYCTKVDSDCIFGYGFNEDEGFDEDKTIPWFTGRFKDLKEATEEEVKEKLLAEAKKRSPVGTTYINASRSSGKETVEQQNFSVPYTLKQVYGEHGKGFLFHEGKWAEIVESTIKVQDYTVEKIDQYHIKVGCKTFENVELYNLYNFLKKHGGVYTFHGKSWSGVNVQKLIDFIETP